MYVYTHIYVALAESVRGKETALEELRKELVSQHDNEQWKLSEAHSAEISKLNGQLMDKSAELDLATEELKGLKSAVAKSEQGLGSATGQVENCLLYTSPSPRDATLSRMPSSA